MIALALDVSHHAGELTREQFERAKKRNVQRIIVGCNPANLLLARRHMDNAQAAGMEVEGYIYYYFAQNLAVRTQAVLGALPDYVRRVWVDVEDSTSGKTAAQIVTASRVEYDRIVASGRTSGIYTAKWFWDSTMQGTTALSDLPLWDAWWNDVQDMTIRPYGGWTAAEMRQIKGDLQFNDIWCDLNVYEPAPVVPPSEVIRAHITEIRTRLDAIESLL